MGQPLRIHTLQHVSFEGLGTIHPFFLKRGHTFSMSHLYRGDGFPALDQLDFLVIMGGPMSVHDEDEFPWLAEEKRFIRAAIDAGKTVLGICLGAQLIAHVLGSAVTAMGYREIGWFSVEATQGLKETGLTEVFPEEFVAFHWHGDTFANPENALPLLQSQACQNQAFLYRERVLGLQFHLEFTPSSVETLIHNSQSDLDGSDWVQSPAELLSESSRFEEIHRLMDKVLDYLESKTHVRV